MYNIVLDRLPSEYKGYLIRSDFRIGIQINACLSDSELTTEERVSSALFLLFGNGVPEFSIAYAGLVWFLSGGKRDITVEDADDISDSSEPDVMDLEQDITYIYSAFIKCYSIDLATERMHWFKFIALLNDISDCMMTNIMDIRTIKLSDIDKKNRAKVSRLKSKYALERDDNTDEETKAKIDRFNELAGIE